MNKLQRLLTNGNDAIKDVRAKFISEDMEHAQKKLIEDLTEQKRQLARRLSSLSDMYPNSELSLRVVRKEFDPNQWAEDTQNVKVELLNNEIELATAQETYDEWFDEANDPIVDTINPGNETD